MKPEDLISFGPDKHVSQLPRESARRASGAAARAPAVWNRVPVREIGGLWGAFPRRFVAWAHERLGRPAHHRMLHVCSGSLPADTLGIRVDIRSEVAPDVIADGRALPFADESFGAVLIDPPYSVEYARTLYDTDYPRPSALLREAARVVRPCGRVGFLHFLVPRPEGGLRIAEVTGVTQGCGYRIRAFTVFVREQAGLWDSHEWAVPTEERR